MYACVKPHYRMPQINHNSIFPQSFAITYLIGIKRFKLKCVLQNLIFIYECCCLNEKKNEKEATQPKGKQKSFKNVCFSNN